MWAFVRAIKSGRDREVVVRRGSTVHIIHNLQYYKNTEITYSTVCLVTLPTRCPYYSVNIQPAIF